LWLLLRNQGLFPVSANEQVCRSWEGAQPGSQPKLANGNIPYYKCHAQFINGGCGGGGRRHFALLIFVSLDPLLFKLFWEFSEICEFGFPQLPLRDWL